MPASLYTSDTVGAALYIADFQPRPVIGIEKKRNPETGVVTLRYPITWIDLAEYTLGEIRRSGGAANMPEQYRSMPDNTVIKVLHRPEQAAAPSFVQSCYNLPLMRGVHASDGLHMLRKGDSSKVVGLFGRTMEIRNIGGNPTPTLDAAIHDLETQLEIEAGADESSLSYTCGHDWTGGVWKGVPYQMEHVLDDADPRIAALILKQGSPRGNHCTIALRPGDSRGYRRTVLHLDTCGVPHGGGYAEPMRFTLNAAAAKRMPAPILALAGVTGGRTADGPITVEIADSDIAAVNAFATALAQATSEIASSAEASAATVAEQGAALGALQAGMPELEADAAEGRAARLEKFRAVAVSIGTPADKLAAADTVDAAREVAVLHAVPDLAKRLPVADNAARSADRKHAIGIAWDTLVATAKRTADAAKIPPVAAPPAGTRPLASDSRAAEPTAEQLAANASNDAESRKFLGLSPTPAAK